jgi:predicted RNA binding protein YcfA (HicA-like mRNA interferase family)
MGKLPVISGQEAIDAFTKAGWRAARQKGSHVSLVKNGNINVLTIPLHKELDRGLLHSQIRRSGLTEDEFIALL